jgi:hypothetical protein
VLASWRCARERDLWPARPVSAQFGPPPFFSFFFLFNCFKNCFSFRPSSSQ